MNAATISVATPPTVGDTPGTGSGDTAGTGTDGEAAAAFAGVLTAALASGGPAADSTAGTQSAQGTREDADNIDADEVVADVGTGVVADTSGPVLAEVAAPKEAEVTAGPIDVVEGQDGRVILTAPVDPTPADPAMDDAAMAGDAPVVTTADQTDGAAFRARLQSRTDGRPTATTIDTTAAAAIQDTDAPAGTATAELGAETAPTSTASAAATTASAEATTPSAELAAGSLGQPTKASGVTATGEAAVAGTSPTAPPPPANQLASAVAAMRRHGDGEYTASLDLHPAELGRLQVEVEIRAGVVNVHVNAEQSATRSMLAAQLDDLRNALAQGGLEAGELDVSQQGWSDRSPHHDESDTDRRESATPLSQAEVPETAAATTVLVPDSGLDVRL